MTTILAWRKSSKCANGTCVEVADGGEGGSWYLRDGKNPDQPPVQFTHDEWAGFLTAIKVGEFDRR